MSGQASKTAHVLGTVMRTVALLVLAAGLGLALLLPAAYWGPCSVLTEFHCGYHSQTELKVLIGITTVAAAALIWIAAHKVESPRTDPSQSEQAVPR
jgi:UPF0716 family protein affecting phage T7 exclusion